MSSWHWILDEQRRPHQVPLMEWGEWMEANYGKRHVGDEQVGGCRVSTVFLGLDHSFGDGPPIFWETMVFGDGSFDLDQERCGGSWDQAEEMHARMVRRVREAFGIPEPKETAT